MAPLSKEPYCIFLDSNVILSGLLSDRGAPRIILDIATLRIPDLHFLTCSYNLEEIKRNLQRKLPQALPVFEEYFPRLQLEILPYPSPQQGKIYLKWVPAKDAPILAATINVGCHYLITGDTKHFHTPQITSAKLPIRIMMPTDFMEKELLKLVTV